MKVTSIIVGGLAALASAHSDHREDHAGLPKLMGGRKFLSELKARGALPSALEDAAMLVEERQEPVESTLEVRQNANGRCGVGFGAKCTTGCCSAAGFCGTGKDYCAAPDCQLAYGPACDGNQVPAGNSTAGIKRPQIGAVPYGGAGIYDCAVPGDIALTFDDGPYIYTSDLLDKLKAYGAKATFFITGNNLGKGAIDTNGTWSAIIKRMATEGHQIASHTWSHQNLTSLDPTTFKNQMIYNEMAFRNILGYFPTYMRPPYSECNATCGNLLATLGYHVTYFDLDTAGYLNDSPTLIQNSKNIWDSAINPSNNNTDSFLQIEHDIHFQTVYNLTDYILASMQKHGYKGVTTGDCLGDPAANWYRSGDPNVVVTVPQTVSQDGSCSASVTCLGSVFGNCCSQYGFCGTGTPYCGTGCQSGSGTCGTSSSTSISSTASSTVSSSKISSQTSTTSSSTKTSTTSSSKISSTTSTISSGTKISTTSTSILSSKISSTASTISSSTKVSTSTSISSSKISSTASTISSSTKVSTASTSISSSKISSTTSSIKQTTSSSPTLSIVTTSKATTTSTSKASTTTSKATSTSSAAMSKSTDGSCGGTITCQGSTFGNCCSQYGWCGSTTAYCGTGCKPAFGTCA